MLTLLAFIITATLGAFLLVVCYVLIADQIRWHRSRRNLRRRLRDFEESRRG